MSPVPFEFQKVPEVYPILEKIQSETSDLVNLPHCHTWPEHFPRNFKGKIIFVERDPRAVAVSAFHFLGKLYPWYFEKHELTDVNKFATHYFENKLPWGRNDKYDGVWKEFAKNNNELKIHFLKYEGMKSILARMSFLRKSF